MAADVGSAILVEIAKKFIQQAADATVRQFGYLFCYKSNISNLEQRFKDLKLIRDDAENYWKSFADNNEETTDTGTAWLEKVKDVEQSANAIKGAIEKPKTGCLSKWCPNPKERYLLSRKAVKKAEDIRQLQIQGRAYVPLKKPAIPPSKLTGAMANDDSKDFESRAKIMDDIMEALKDNKISIIGVCGPGGVGKTTLMHELRERAKVNDLFDEVAMATVSQNPNLPTIRCKLAEMLGLPRVMDGKNEIAAADELHKRLAGKGRRALVILDDIWNEINLEELGIPVKIDQAECKVVLTSRQNGICVQMKASKTISIPIMPPEEAWNLFRKTVGDCVERDDLKKIAEKVAGECGGLPVALVTLAKALSKKDIRIWKDAYNQLREHIVTRLPDMDKKVYSSIKMSYDFLANEQPEAKRLLLLCCQHPEDAKIEVEDLVRYCLALRLLKNVDTLDGVRNSVCTLIDYLKSCFLLEVIDDDDDNENQGYDKVKMHDVIRDVGLSIISEVKEERDSVYMHIVSLGTSHSADYPNVKILQHLHGNLLTKGILSQMEELRVLEYYSQQRDDQLPPLDVLTNLRMLSFYKATINEDTLSNIGRLTKLEILRFRCREIGPFPSQIRQLSNLKLLDLRCPFSSDIQPIPKGIMPQLNNLEELYLASYYFLGTREDDKESMEGESHGCIAELDTLVMLTTLQIEFLNPMELLDLHLCFEKLQIFAFGMVGEERNWYSKRSLKFEAKSMEWILGERFESIVMRTAELGLRGMDVWINHVKLEKFVSLRELELVDCHHLEYIICDVGRNGSVFKKLDWLSLRRMSGLTELCHNGNLSEGLLGKLKCLYLYDLPKMRHLWVGPTDPLCLVNLTVVSIGTCGALECIFPYSAAKCLVQLQELVVRDCVMLKGIVSKPEGTTIGRGGEIIKDPTDLILLHFPKLRKLDIEMSSNLRGFYNHDDADDNSRVQPLFSPLVMLPSFEELEVEQLDQLKQIVGCNHKTPDISNCLQNLERVKARSCVSLESVFDFEGIQFMAENAHVLTLAKLDDIDLHSLPNLTSIFRGKMQDISIPKLQRIFVSECSKIGNLVASNLIKLLHNLKTVSMRNCESIESVFDFEGMEVMGEDEPAILGELQDIELWKLPKLEHFCRLAPKEIHVFQNLRKLDVSGCGSLTYLFSSSMARMLEKLSSLIIHDCMSIKECITSNEECAAKKITFSSLSEISLGNLENLSLFCSSEQLEFEFPSLKDVSIFGCPEMKTFCYGHLAAEKLHGVKFADGKPVWKSDLNQTIQHFNASYDEDDDRLRECGNEGTSSKPIKALTAPHDESTPDASLASFDASTSSPAGLIESRNSYPKDDSDDDDKINVNNLSEDGDENAQCNNEVLDRSGTSSSTHLEQGTLPGPMKKAFPPNPSKQTTAHSTSSPLELNDTQADSSTEPEDALSDSSSTRILIQGVYIKANMKTDFEEILAENPNFLSSLRVKTALIKTALVETAINCLQILRQGGISSEQVAYVRDSLDDLAATGLDVTWLERDYQRASIVIDEQKAVLVAAELAKLEKEKTEDEAAFQMAREKLEASTALRDALKAEFNALMKGLESRKELVGGGFDSQRSIGDGLPE